MKTNTQILTVERANQIQADWMALDCNASEAEKRRVFALCAELPKNYFSISADGRAVAIFSGMPANQPMPFLECAKYYGAQLDKHIAWMGDHFVSVPIK